MLLTRQAVSRYLLRYSILRSGTLTSRVTSRPAHREGSPPGGARRQALQLTAGDDGLFRLLFMLGVMTVDHIRRTRYFQEDTGRVSVLENVCRRLKRLRDEHYLEVEDVFTEDRVRVLTYRLGEAALPELHLRNPLITQRRVYRPAERNAHQLLHALMVTECAVRVMESVRGSDLVTPPVGPLELPFYHARVVAEPSKRGALQRFATQHAVLVKGRRDMVRPDLVFALERGSRARLFFLEADRGSEGHGDICRKVRAYDAFARHHLEHPGQRPLWSSYGDTVDSVRVLLVTSGETRLTRLLPVLADTPGGHLVRLATFDEVRKENVVLGLRWWYLGADGVVARDPLMKPRSKA